MERNLIRTLVRNMDELPSLPFVAQRILQMVNDPLAEAENLAKVILMDPSLAAKVLRIANSSLYGLRSEVTTITHAITLLGFQTILQMVLGLSIFEAFKGARSEGGIDGAGLWKHSLATALFSRSMVRSPSFQEGRENRKGSGASGGASPSMGPGAPEEAFLGGLIHDLGKVVLHRLFPEEYRTLAKRAIDQKENLWDLEREILGVTHTETGDWLGQQWRLPRLYRWCMCDHHLLPHRTVMDDTWPFTLAGIVAIGDFFVRLFDIGFSANPWLEVPPRRLWDLMGLKEKDYEEILLSVRVQMEELGSSFQIGSDAEPNRNGSHGPQGVPGNPSLLLSKVPSEGIDPLGILLKSIVPHMDTAPLGKELVLRVRESKPDILVMDLLGYRTKKDSMISFLRFVRKEMKGLMVVLGGEDVGREVSALEDGNLVMVPMLPSQAWLIRLIREAFTGQGVQEVPSGGRIPGHTAVTPLSAPLRALLQGLKAVEKEGSDPTRPWGRKLEYRTKYLHLERARSDSTPQIGDLVGGTYEIVELLGQGGMGEVYKVRPSGSHSFCALKRLSSKFLGDPRMVLRFRTEALRAGQLKHPRIVQLLEYEEDSEHCYFLMELASGWKISPGRIALDVGRLRKPVEVRLTLAILRQVCEGLEYIHRHGIIHRDIKPGNLLLFEGSRVKLSDFGIARSSDSLSLTMTGVPVGTPEYMSPEQIEGEANLEPSSDVYSLGIVAYELLTGVSPFRRKTPLSTLMAHILEPVTAPREKNPAIDRRLQDILLKCLDKSMGKRFQSALELKLAIDDYLETRTDETGEVASLGPR